MANTSARKNILPGLQVPAGLPAELEKFLMAVKEALQGGQGTRGQPKERFVTLEDLERIGLITTMVKNGRGEIKSLNAEGVQTGLGVDFSSSASSVTSMSDLDDVIVTGAIEGDVLRWRATSSKWQRGIAFDASGVLKDAVIPATVPRFDDVFTTTVNGLVPAPITPLGYFLMDDGTWQAASGGGGGGGGTLVYANMSVEAGDTVANTITEMDFQSLYTIPANRLEEAHVIRVWAAGTASNNSGGGATVILRFKLDNGVVLQSDPIALNDGTTDAGWTAEAVVILQGTGASAQAEAQGTIGFGTLRRQWVNSGAGTVDTTIEQDLNLSVEFDTADPDITITQRELTVYLDGVDALAAADAEYLVAGPEDALPNSRFISEGIGIELDFTEAGEFLISTSVDFTISSTWVSEEDDLVTQPSARIPAEGANIELDYSKDNVATIDALPVHHKGAAWSSTSDTVAIDQALAGEITIAVPWNCWIQEVVVTTVGGTGSCVIDVEKGTYSAFPTTNSIAASAKPTVALSTKYSDSTLTGWTRALTAGDVLRFQLESSSVFTQISIVLKLKETP